MTRLIIASTSRDKVAEIRGLLDGLPLDLATLADYPPIEAPEETGLTFGENARLKRLLADAMLDNVALKDLLGKKW